MSVVQASDNEMRWRPRSEPQQLRYTQHEAGWHLQMSSCGMQECRVARQAVSGTRLRSSISMATVGNWAKQALVTTEPPVSSGFSYTHHRKVVDAERAPPPFPLAWRPNPVLPFKALTL